MEVVTMAQIKAYGTLWITTQVKCGIDKLVSNAWFCLITNILVQAKPMARGIGWRTGIQLHQHVLL